MTTSMEEPQTRAQLIERFGGPVAEHEDIMAECLSILRLYNLTPADLFYKYEAFLLSRPSGLRAKLSVLTLETARELRREIQREQQAQAVAGSMAAASPASGSRDAGAGGRSSIGVKKARHGHGDLGGLLNELTGHSTPRAVNGNGVASSNGVGASPSSFATPTRPSFNGSGPSGSHYRPTNAASGSSLMTPVGRTAGSASPLSSPGSADEAGSLMGGPPPPFRSRPQPHSLVETLNPHLPARTLPEASARPRVALSSSSNPKDWDYRYMFEKISHRSEALDEQIDDFGEIIKDAYGLQELGDPHFVSDEAIHTVGRILAPPTDTAKASSAALFLESSRLMGAGKRIALQFPPGQVKIRGGAPGVKNFGLFPGCLVCVKGRNGGGGFFAVEEVLMAPPSPLASTPRSELVEFRDKLRGTPMSLHVSAGPYTLDNDLDFEPLQALLEVAEAERPDALILMGPFIDAQHPIILAGAITRSVADIFRSEISSRLGRLLSVSPGTVIILIPSIRDIVSHHVAFPQAALDKEYLGLPKKVKVLPNPCTFSINEIVLSLSTTDILFHIRREEVIQRGEEAEPSTDPAATATNARDAMAGLVRHVLGQKSFYPLVPVPESLAAEVNLDVTHQSLLRLDGTAPDILILPSKLKHFAKVVDSTLVVNPAFLCRSRTAGTFAKISIQPYRPDRLDQAGEDEVVEHGVFDRARTEIWRI